ncbi:MAG: helix-turn-helix domain-containing protein [Flavobacteriales bacterium]|nr:helix-turn-helix domain-containing protein [Flavobacteriales bacterium]
MNEEPIKLIFGLKLHQHRVARKLSLAELAERAGMSVSYINEIEKGKKYPSTEKMSMLASALDVPYDRLVSLKLDKQLAPVGDILRSKILDELPLDLFGIDKGKLIEIIASAPLKVSAFISAISHIAQTYELTQEGFYLAMLRSYQEMHDGYFEEIEKEALRFRKEFGLPDHKAITSDLLKNILLDRFGYEVKESAWEEYPELVHIRSMYIHEARRIVVNALLAENQKAFLYAKELGYQFLDLTGQRALMTPWPRATSFDHVLNNSRASYFAGALLISPQHLAEQMEGFFSAQKCSPGPLLDILNGYNSSPEMFVLRLMNILPRYFGFQGMFFMRFDHFRSADSVELKKQLHLSRSRESGELAMLERFSSEWMRQSVFPQLMCSKKGIEVSVQRFVSADGHRSHLAISLARTTGRNPDFSLAVTFGFEENASFRKKVHWAEDASIPVMHMLPSEREVQREARFQAIEQAMKRLMEEEMVAE